MVSPITLLSLYFIAYTFRLVDSTVNVAIGEMGNEISNPEDAINDASDNANLKSIKMHFDAHTQSEGAGFIVNRPIGGRIPDSDADPFLLLDEVGPKMYKPGEFAGAPMHPHRGFDTVMYSRKGNGLRHSDSTGGSGVLNEGDCQWMTAGSGIIHDEGKDHPGGELHGFQLWINLPAANKWTDPQYQQITGKNFQFREIETGVRVKVIAGSVNDVSSPIHPLQPISYLDFELDQNAAYTYDVPSEQTTVIVYVYEGTGRFGGKSGVNVHRKSTILFGEGESVRVVAGRGGLKFLLLAGKPIGEPIARHGPFVMNTQQELEECFRDYQNGNLVRVQSVSEVIY